MGHDVCSDRGARHRLGVRQDVGNYPGAARGGLRIRQRVRTGGPLRDARKRAPSLLSPAENRRSASRKATQRYSCGRPAPVVPAPNNRCVICTTNSPEVMDGKREPRSGTAEQSPGTAPAGWGHVAAATESAARFERPARGPRPGDGARQSAGRIASGAGVTIATVTTGRFITAWFAGGWLARRISSIATISAGRFARRVARRVAGRHQPITVRGQRRRSRRCSRFVLAPISVGCGWV